MFNGSESSHTMVMIIKLHFPPIPFFIFSLNYLSLSFPLSLFLISSLHLQPFFLETLRALFFPFLSFFLHLLTLFFLPPVSFFPLLSLFFLSYLFFSSPISLLPLLSLFFLFYPSSSSSISLFPLLSLLHRL